MENTRGLVSVLMPVYNGDPDIKKSINSLLWQTYKNWECIIVNDGSTDGTKDLLNSIEDKRFHIINLLENKGRGNARQVALSNASGEFIAYLDSDDWYAPDKIEKQVLFLNDYPEIDLVAAGVYSYGTRTSIQRVRGLKNNSVQVYREGNIIPFTCASTMLRSNILKDISYNINIDYGEDVDFFSRCLIDKKFMIADQILYYYSEFDSISVSKMRRVYRQICKREKKINVFFKYLFFLSLAPLIGINLILRLRGKRPTKFEKRKFAELYRKLKGTVD